MNLIIMGESRSGKTMLANMIASKTKGYSKISTDALRTAFKRALPETNIGFSKGKGSKEDFPCFLENVFDFCVHCDNPDIFYIIEGTPLPEQYVLKFKDKPNTKVVFLGKPSITPEEFFNLIRHHDSLTHSWTRRLEDEKLLSWCIDWIRKSKKHQEFCEEYGIEFIDTSYNQPQILKKFIKRLKLKSCVRK